VRLAIVNLFYPPDLAASAHFPHSLAEHRAALGDDVTVICGSGSYLGGHSASRDDPATGHTRVRVVRVWTPSLGKATAAKRLADYLTFLVAAVARLAFAPRQDVVIAMTAPPYALVAAVVHRLIHPRSRVVFWCHDVYPDAAEEYGQLRRGGVASRALRALQRWLLGRTDLVVALDDAMLERALAHADPGRRPAGSVIPNWEPAALFPAGASPPPWSGYAGVEAFVVLYLGNLGYGHPIETIAEAAARLDGEGVTFEFVGGGVRYPELAAEARRRQLSNVVLHPYVPKDETPSVLAGAGCALISLDDRSLGIMSPCKLHGALATGTPVVYVGPTGSNVDRAIDTFTCGSSVRQGDVEGLVAAIRRLRDDAALASELSQNARKAFDEAYCDEQTLPQFDRLLGGLTRSGATPAGSS
jgi:glycosyltransferase involved in cell wall biosynthesis